MSPGGRDQLHHPLVAVLVLQTKGIGVGAVVGGQQAQREPVVECGRSQSLRGIGRQADDRDVAQRRVLGAHRKTGQSLVVDTRALFIARVVELPRRPPARVAAPGHGRMGVPDVEARQIQARAADQHRLGIGLGQRLAHHGREAQQRVLLTGRQGVRAVAEVGNRRRGGRRRCGRRSCTACREHHRGQCPGPRPACSHSCVTARGASSSCQSSASTRKNASRVSPRANSRP